LPACRVVVGMIEKVNALSAFIAKGRIAGGEMSHRKRRSTIRNINIKRKILHALPRTAVILNLYSKYIRVTPDISKRWLPAKLCRRTMSTIIRNRKRGAGNAVVPAHRQCVTGIGIGSIDSETNRIAGADAVGMVACVRQSVDAAGCRNVVGAINNDKLQLT